MLNDFSKSIQGLFLDRFIGCVDENSITVRKVDRQGSFASNFSAIYKCKVESQNVPFSGNLDFDFKQLAEQFEEKSFSVFAPEKLVSKIVGPSIILSVNPLITELEKKILKDLFLKANVKRVEFFEEKDSLKFYFDRKENSGKIYYFLKLGRSFSYLYKFSEKQATVAIVENSLLDHDPENTKEILPNMINYFARKDPAVRFSTIYTSQKIDKKNKFKNISVIEDFFPEILGLSTMLAI